MIFGLRINKLAGVYKIKSAALKSRKKFMVAEKNKMNNLKELIKINKENEVLDNPIIEDRVKIMIDLIPENTQSVLDFGCRTGEMTYEISKKFLVIGVDIVPEFIEKAQNNYPELNFTLAENDTRKYDCIILGEVLEHCIDPKQTLSDLKKRLNENGCMIISTPNICSLRKRVKCGLGINPIQGKNHLHEFTRNELVNMFHDLGFEVDCFSNKFANTHIFRLYEYSIRKF
jgi:2-polyprenyl-3-methyl-5-hydroxy-6-metoxy-1,4-benzoquinol methylase